MSTRAPGGRERPAVPAATWPAWLAAAADATGVLLFAAVGRASHAAAHPVLGALGTAWPFLAGAAAAWAVLLLLRRRAPVTLRDGTVVWAGALVLGMLLRSGTGRGTAAPFVVVASLVLAALLLGWRLVAAAGRRRGR